MKTWEGFEMIMTISGRRVKRSVKIFTAERGRRKLCGGVPVCIRQAKAPAPWAGYGYRLTRAGQAEMENAETFERRQSAYHALGLHALADVREIRRGYAISLREICGVRLVCFQSGWHRDSVAVQVTGDTDNPFDCCEMGPEVRLPNVSFELAAQLWMDAQEGGAA